MRPQGPSRACIAIDLKSFYASVECTERGLDPLTAHLVVADERRTDKTICLAVSPSLKAYGIPGRTRLYDVKQKLRQVNRQRERNAPGHRFTGRSASAPELEAHPEYEADFVIARPRMAYYMHYSSLIYNIYRKYVDAKDIHVYSIDEVFIEATEYLRNYGMTAHELAMAMIRDVLAETRITATAGIGTNLYLSKIAMDIMAKRLPADADGVRIAELDEMSFRRELWAHRPLTDFWRIGRGTARKLEQIGLYTMGDIARCSLGGPRDALNEDVLYDLLGVNAETLIDHAWGWEPCTVADIRRYRPERSSITAGQVLKEPYTFERSRMVLREMADSLALTLVERGQVCGSVSLMIGYDTENLTDPARAGRYRGPVVTDFYGRQVPKHAGGTKALEEPGSSSRAIIGAALGLFERIADPGLLIRRLSLSAGGVADEAEVRKKQEEAPVQLNLLEDPEDLAEREAARRAKQEKEKRRQQAILDIQKRYGKNAILRGVSYEEGATARERNGLIGGHNA
ncbi:MAG: DNA methylase [Clostridia bacterium]|nr:DNA methylase [Clostridia bacterium]